MIRGSIETVTRELVKGWIHVENATVRDQVVLAFCGGACVGSSGVNVFRDDLASAGLGDGYLGFEIPVTVDKGSVGTIVVRLEGSDAVLLQSGALVSGSGADPRRLDRNSVKRRLASLKWSLKHGRVSQADFDFQRMLCSLGAYERGLVHRSAGEEELVRHAPNEVIEKLLESFIGQDIQAATVSVRNPVDFKNALARVAADPNLLPIVAISTKDVAMIRVLEGSHVEGSVMLEDKEGKPQYTEFPLTHENILILESRLVAELEYMDGVPVEIGMVTASPIF